MTTIEKIASLEVIEVEYCRSPWNPDCKNPDIEVYVVLEGTKIPICRTCWLTIAETDLEW